jgi:hypothetical protein
VKLVLTPPPSVPECRYKRAAALRAMGEDELAAAVDLVPATQPTYVIIAGCETGQMATYDLSIMLGKLSVDPTVKTKNPADKHGQGGGVAHHPAQRLYARVLRQSALEGMSDHEINQLLSKMRNPVGKSE